MNLLQGSVTIVDALRDLSDAPASAKETEQLKQTCLKISGVLAVSELKARKSGPYLYVESSIDVDGTISASAAHRSEFYTFFWIKFDLLTFDAVFFFVLTFQI
jgi:divalent metal cation (Fe/Co/Zn/Cd) transporter